MGKQEIGRGKEASMINEGPGFSLCGCTDLVSFNSVNTFSEAWGSPFPGRNSDKTNLVSSLKTKRVNFYVYPKKLSMGLLGQFHFTVTPAALGPWSSQPSSPLFPPSRKLSPCDSLHTFPKGLPGILQVPLDRWFSISINFWNPVSR